MGLNERLQTDMVTAMKAKDSFRLTTIRLIRAAVNNKEIATRESPLTDVAIQAIMATMVKQRRDSIEAFTKGNRPDLAEKEASEITILEEYMPREIDEAGLRTLVVKAVSDFEKANSRQATPKDMGTVMKLAQAELISNSLRADGKALSNTVKETLKG
jgi:uncharacterized protein YqeY